MSTHNGTKTSTAVLFVLTFTAMIINGILSQSSESTFSPCNAAVSCSECLRSFPSCAWCPDAGYAKTNAPRCETTTNLIQRGCGPKKWIYENSTQETLKINDFQSNYSLTHSVIQVKPQHFKAKLRLRKAEEFTVLVKLAKDYPVDLYFLMDLSESMFDDLQNLKKLGTALSERMLKLTRDFRAGFGAFVDKKTSPFISENPNELERPCNVQIRQGDGSVIQEACIPPFSFKNLLRLTPDKDKFAEVVKEQKVSGNLDSPEGGLDAMMQVAVCNDSIGWRERARHLMVFTTDASSHWAGDGKLAGIVKPNDAMCHVNSNGDYFGDIHYDYPTIAQINEELESRNIQTIFAVTEDNINLYRDLAKFIKGSTTGVLANDSRNIIELVEDNYKKITSTVKLEVTKGLNGVEVEFWKKCRFNGAWEIGDTCSDVSINEKTPLMFKVKITAMEYREGTHQLTIQPVGIKEEVLFDLDFIGECECEKTTLQTSPQCNGNGTFKCGACYCNQGFSGQNCSCSEENSNYEINEACIMPGTQVPCKDRGNCFCGKCVCVNSEPNRNVWGEFCECDTNNCRKYKEKPCGGHGDCICGKGNKTAHYCKCHSGYEGEACHCPTSTDTCLATNGKSCNGQGVCVCGVCKCRPDSNFRGETCEDCSTCVPRVCKINWPCVQCRVDKTGEYDEKTCDEQCPEVKMVAKLEVTAAVERCVFKDQDGCRVAFGVVKNQNGQYDIYVQEERVCARIVSILWVVLAILLGIVAVGVALLLTWKVITTFQDRREFAKFEKERMNAKWDTGENPIYKQATSSFQNPMFHKS